MPSLRNRPHKVKANQPRRAQGLFGTAGAGPKRNVFPRVNLLAQPGGGGGETLSFRVKLPQGRGEATKAARAAPVCAWARAGLVFGIIQRRRGKTNYAPRAPSRISPRHPPRPAAFHASAPCRPGPGQTPEARAAGASPSLPFPSPGREAGQQGPPPLLPKGPDGEACLARCRRAPCPCAPVPRLLTMVTLALRRSRFSSCSALHLSL